MLQIERSGMTTREQFKLRQAMENITIGEDSAIELAELIGIAFDAIAEQAEMIAQLTEELEVLKNG